MSDKMLLMLINREREKILFIFSVRTE